MTSLWHNSDSRMVWHQPWSQEFVVHAIRIPNIGTGKSEQTVQTQSKIRAYSVAIPFVSCGLYYWIIKPDCSIPRNIMIIV